MKSGNIKKILLFSAFIIASIIIGTLWELYPIPPTKAKEDPYNVNINQLNHYQEFLEGKTVTVTDTIFSTSQDIENDSIAITLKDQYFNYTLKIVFYNWSNIKDKNTRDLNEGETVCIKGIALLHSKGVILGTSVHVIHSNLVNILSIIGLIIISIPTLYYFKIDFKKLHFTPKARKKTKIENKKEAKENKR
ncbi:MAG: hypothetical protein ACTSXU_15120 [Promethearchaeota archaeon]